MFFKIETIDTWSWRKGDGSGSTGEAVSQVETADVEGGNNDDKY